MCSSLSGSATVTSRGGLALVLGDEFAERPDHVAHREQPAVRRHELEEFRGEAADAGAVEHRGQRLQLIVGGEDRAADQPHEVGAFGDQRIEARRDRPDRVDRIRLAGQIEQRGRIAARHAGDDGFFSRQVSARFAAGSAFLWSISATPATSPQSIEMAGNKPLLFKMKLKRDLVGAGVVEKGLSLAWYGPCTAPGETGALLT